MNDYYGIYKAKCADVADGYYRVLVPQVLGDAKAILHAWTGLEAPTPGEMGFVSFVAGDPAYPVWVGGGTFVTEIRNELIAVSGDYEPGGAIATHAADTTSVHGIDDTNDLVLASTLSSYATTASLSAYATDTDLTNHTSATTSVHGIADTSVLVTDTDLSNHTALTTGVHGIADTSDLLVTSDLSNHTATTTSVHGIADTADLLTTSYPPRAKAVRDASQTISDNTTTAIQFNEAVEYDNSSIFSSANNTRLTVPSGMDGEWLFVGNSDIGPPGSGVGRYQLTIAVNGGSSVARQSQQGNNIDNTLGMNISWVGTLSAGDYVELRWFYDSADATESATNSWFSAQYLGP